MSGNAPTAPVCALTDGNGIYTFIDTPNALTFINFSKHSPSRNILSALSNMLLPSNFRSLHSCTEAHSGVCLRYSASHTAQKTGGTRTKSSRLRDTLHTIGSKQKNTSFSGSLDPRLQSANQYKPEQTYPRNKTLVEAQHTTPVPDGFESIKHRLSPIRGHLCLDHLKRLTKCCHLKHIHHRT